MSKRLQSMRASPSSDWRISDVEALCRDHDLICIPPRGGGSHYKVSHSALPEILTIPFARPIKPVYIRKLVQMVDAVERL